MGILYRISINVIMTRTNHQAGETTPVSDLNDQNENHMDQSEADVIADSEANEEEGMDTCPH